MSGQSNETPVNPFQNPDKISLEKLELRVYKDGNFQQIPALSPTWREERTFLNYEAPKIYNENGSEIMGAQDHWCEIVTYIINDLKWLLQLPFYKFWSNIRYNPSISDSLVTCLQESPTFYNLDNFPNSSKMRELLENLRRNVLVIFARLVTSKESKEAFMSHEFHGELLYDNFLLTVPMMLDICQLYGRENRKMVERMLSTAIKLQPLYKNDFEEMAMFLSKVFTTAAERFEDRPVPLAAGAIPLSKRPRHVVTIDDLEDLVIHLLDVSSNISVLLDCYEPASDFLCNENLVNEIVSIYGNTIPEMYKRLEPLAHADMTIAKYTELKHLLDVTRVELLKVFRQITYHKIAKILEQPNPSKVPGASEDVDTFVNFLEKAVSEKEFLLDYNVSYPIEDDLDLVTQISNDVDPVKQNFIKRCVDSQFVEHGPRDESRQTTINNATSNVAIASGSRTATISIPSDNERIASNGTASKDPNDPAVIASLIYAVKDILSDLGEGFIERCLKHYNYDVTAVVNGVFEDTLPESLKTLDRTLPYIPPDPEESAAANDLLLGTERLNVFDNDEFDIMTRDTIDKSRVHKGKRKDGYKNFGQLLDDKTYRKETGDIYQKYSIIQDDYEDEYDDTYDSHEIGPGGVDEPLEMDGRAFTTPRVLRWNDKREADDEEEDEDAEEAQQSEGPSRGPNDRVNFVQDPAEVRARNEQRRLSKRGGGGGSGARGGRGGSQADLVGKPKGQGNDKNVLVNRDRKNTHKASRGNHNRRSGADFKRRQGMVP